MLATEAQVRRACLLGFALVCILAGGASTARADVEIPPPGMSEAEFESLIAAEIAVDMANLLPPGTLVVNDFCYQDSFAGCLGRVDVTVHGSPPPSHGSQSIDVGTLTTSLPVDLTLDDIEVTAKVKAVTGVGFTCYIDLSAGTSTVDSDLTLAEIPASSQIDVTQPGSVTVWVGSFSDSTDCDGFLGFIVEALISLVIGDIQTLLTSALQTSMDSVDGNGNTPIAAAVEDAYVVVAVPALSPMGLGSVAALLSLAPFVAARSTRHRKRGARKREEY
jgi:hypothetical protein